MSTQTDEQHVREVIESAMSGTRASIANRSRRSNFWRNRPGFERSGISEPTPTTTPGTDSFLETPWMSARSS